MKHTWPNRQIQKQAHKMVTRRSTQTRAPDSIFPPISPKSRHPRTSIAAASPQASPSTRSSPKTPTSSSFPARRGGISKDARRRSLPTGLCKSLAIAIEEHGSFKVLDKYPQGISQLCDKKGFGERGDSVREQIRRKVRYWKKLEANGTYHQQVLNKFGIKCAKDRAELKSLGELELDANTSNDEFIDESDNENNSSSISSSKNNNCNNDDEAFLGEIERDSGTDNDDINTSIDCLANTFNTLSINMSSASPPGACKSIVVRMIDCCLIIV